jgi:dTMP kinase
MFFTFEGGEGAGKTSLIAFLQMALVQKGYSVLVTREPGGTTLGKKIRQILLDQQEFVISKRAELLLFLSDRAQHIEELVVPFLKKKGIVLCDRFIDSSLAYQSGVFPLEDLLKLNLYATNHLMPDRTFYLDLDPKIGFERIMHLRQSAFDRMEKKEFSFHEEVRSKFLELADMFPQRICKMDASLPKEILHQQVLENMLKFIHERSRATNPS